MLKSYEIKLYTQKWVFKKQINLRNNINEITFSENIDWWQGDLTLQIIWNLNNFSTTDIIEIREVSKENKTVIPTYTWIIESIEEIEYKNWTLLNIELLWVFTILNDVIYKNSWNKTFTKTDTAWNIVKNIIDTFNLEYWDLVWETQNLWNNIITYTTESIDITWTTLSIEFENLNCLEAIKKVIENTNYNFYIDETWLCTLQLKENWVLKHLTFDKELISINKKIKKSEMVNKYYLSRTWDVEKIYSNSTSITTFNLKEKVETKSEIQDETTQDEKWNTYIDEYSNERTEISINMKAQINNFLCPGMLITTQNTKNQLFSQQITKIQKNRDNWILYLWDVPSIGKQILKLK